MSQTFAGANRHKQFLEYIVLKFLESGNENVSEYNIALDVFRRRQSFDPKIDPIVRVEARRLRARLRKYAATEGRNDAITIELSARGYMPAIKRVNTPDCQLRLAVLPFLDMSAKSGRNPLADLLTEELIDILTDIPRIKVSPHMAVLPFKTQGANIALIARQLNVELLLEGSLRQAGDKLRVRVRLIDANKGFSERIAGVERRVVDDCTTVQQIARLIAGALEHHVLPRYSEMPIRHHSLILHDKNGQNEKASTHVA